MSTISLSIQASLITQGNFFVVTLSDASNPNVVLQVKNPPPPYGAPFQVAFNGLTAGKMYNINLWESTNTTPTGTLINATAIAPTDAPTAKSRPSLILQADATTGLTSGGASYIDPTSSLLGWDYLLQENGLGSLQKGTDYTTDANNNWTLINGEVIQTGQVFSIIFTPQISTAPKPPTSLINSAMVINANINLTSANVNMDLLLMGASQYMIINLPDISTVADFDPLYFISAGGNHINASIRCISTDYIQRKTQVYKIVLAQNEFLTIFKYTPVTGSAYWIVREISPTVDMVGQFIYSYDKNETNGVFADGRYLNRSIYERLYDKALLNGKIVNDSVWIFGKYSNGSDITNFRIPDFTQFGFQQGVSGSIVDAGDTVTQNVGRHDHVTHGQGMITRNGGAIRGFISRMAGLLSNSYSAGGPDQFGASEMPDRGMLTDFNTVSENPLVYNPKNMVDNTACFISIRV